MPEQKALLILGNQLFKKSLLPPLEGLHVFMAEDSGLCTHFRYHKHKIILFLAAMRSYADELESAGAKLSYERLSKENSERSYEEKLSEFIKKHEIDTLLTFEIEDKFFEKRIEDCCQELGVALEILPTPMFLFSREDFAEYLQSVKQPFMKTFYERMRRKTGILMEDDSSPVGGKYSFDAENRKKLPRDLEPPEIPSVKDSLHVKEVSQLTEVLFSEHPGSVENFWLPTSRSQSLAWLRQFFKERFEHFGSYEDAISQRNDLLYHSALSPLLNCGLLTPEEVIEKALDAAQQQGVALNSLEGFIRQIMGWREFVRGIYQHYSERQEGSNFWGHSKKLASCWYDASTGLEPLDDAIAKTIRLGYNHHIERLMLISNVMLLSEIDPEQVYRWFMEMYVDSSDWVMVPNVYGMAQFSDGGLFATKPYICGSNYVLKMSSYKKGPWCEVMDGLYWSFVEKHRDFFAQNPRSGAMVHYLDRMKAQRREKIYPLAEEFRARVTQ